MEPKEALSILDGRTSVVTNQAEQREWAARTEAIIALREKVAREEKPTWPLEILERQLRNCSVAENLRKYGDHSLHDAAADILKTLRERGGELLAGGYDAIAYRALLIDIGVQPKEA